MLAVFSVSFTSVLRVLLVCLAGTWLARRGILTADFRRSISRLVLHLMLPCLLITKLSATATAANLLQWAALPLSALVYVGLGFLTAAIVLALVRPPPAVRRVVTIATVFGNSGYIPYPLLAAVAGSAALFRHDAQAGERAIAYVSLYLVCYSPCLWGIGYPLLANKPFRSLHWGQLFSPPILSALTGILIGITPPLRALLVGDTAPLHVVLAAADLVGQGAIPCALLVLGANLADRVPGHAALPPRVLAGLVWGRLVLMPIFGCTYVLVLHRVGLVGNDPMLLLVLMLESAVPPATNLIVMCQSHEQGEAAMSRILVVTYLVAVVSLTAFVALFLQILSRL